MSDLYRDFIDQKADQIINSLGGTITPAPANAELYRDFLDRKFDDVITAIINMSTGGVLSGDTAPNNADGDNNDIYVQYDSSYNVVALYVKLNDIWRFISTSGSNHTYSTTEQVVGTWIDGRPVYEIVLETDTPVQLNNYEWNTIPWNNEPSDVALIISALVVDTCPNSNVTLRFMISGGHIKGASLVTNDYPPVPNMTCRVIIRYIKSV